MERWKAQSAAGKLRAGCVQTARRKSKGPANQETDAHFNDLKTPATAREKWRPATLARSFMCPCCRVLTPCFMFKKNPAIEGPCLLRDGGTRSHAKPFCWEQEQVPACSFRLTAPCVFAPEFERHIFSKTIGASTSPALRECGTRCRALLLRTRACSLVAQCVARVRSTYHRSTAPRCRGVGESWRFRSKCHLSTTPRRLHDSTTPTPRSRGGDTYCEIPQDPGTSFHRSGLPYMRSAGTASPIGEYIHSCYIALIQL